ncbi:MAG: DnaA regulatory inactivator Hda [Steroidobacteraceae bacterium]
MQQLSLGVRLQDRATFASFVWPPDSAAATALAAFADGSGLRTLLVHGPAGSGKSHLLQACCAAQPVSAYLPLRLLGPAGPGVLEGADTLPLLAVDDLDAVVGDAGWEQALFRLYNDCEAAGVRVIFASSLPPGALQWQLPDLRSRLQHLLALPLAPLDDALQIEALQRHAEQRGLTLPVEAAQYLQRRLPRDMASLVAALDRLDAASLREQRRLTVPFIRQACGLP